MKRLVYRYSPVVGSSLIPLVITGCSKVRDILWPFHDTKKRCTEYIIVFSYTPYTLCPYAWATQTPSHCVILNLFSSDTDWLPPWSIDEQTEKKLYILYVCVCVPVGDYHISGVLWDPERNWVTSVVIWIIYSNEAWSIQSKRRNCLKSRFF